MDQLTAAIDFEANPYQKLTPNKGGKKYILLRQNKLLFIVIKGGTLFL